ncbi:MAG: exodeoxyribonuclease VII small subunit [Oligoflexia bacterium]|nr:exodeoxyribonuclease VII small subunit [Oligoflexia bacterium]
METKIDFEKNLKRLEEIVHKLEDGEIALEESLKLFEEGVKISRECNKKLVDAEKRVKQLLSVNADGEVTTKDFINES